ncbi:hypothetical protein SH139x_005679 [Planctomycetaceae bacterium SH139]
MVSLLSLAVLWGGFPATACPFCTSIRQTLREEMAAMDAVVIAEATADSIRDEETGEVPLRVVSVLKGGEFIEPGAIIRTVYYGGVDAGRRFMLSGVEPKALLWSSPLPVDSRSEEYLSKVMQLPAEDIVRLRFFQQYLEDESSMLAADAYDEFASTPFESIKKLKDEMDHDQLVAWIKDPEMTINRRRLYLVMLSVCGTEDDVAMLEAMLRSTQPADRKGLDSLVSCYLTLAGRDGLATVEELFLANKQAPYADTFAAILAIRFQGSEADVIPRSDLLKTLHSVLERPDLADLVIPDLARWSDWTQIDRLVQLFKEADADTNWIRVPVVNYMRACPLPAAKEAIEKFKEIDPDAVKRANTFFSEPVVPDSKVGETSQYMPPNQGPASQATSFAKIAQVSTPVAGQTLASANPPPIAKSVRNQAPANDLAANSLASDNAFVNANSLVGLAGPNRWRLLSVVGTAGLTFLIMGFLVISGGPQPRPEMVPVKVRR